MQRAFSFQREPPASESLASLPQHDSEETLRGDEHAISTDGILLKDRRKSSQSGSERESDNGKFTVSDSQMARLPEIEGVRLWLLVGVLFVALLLSSLEQLIVSIALTNIASDLGDYKQSSWVVTTYLMAYNGFLVLFARASDIFGRRSTFMVALVIFTIASTGCGVSQTMIQLIVFRAFQGVGGAGLFTLSLNIATEIPGKARTIVQALIPAAFGISAGIAPVIGGAIVTLTTWRWIFLLNIPPGVIIIVLSFFFFPKNAVPLKLTWRDVTRRIDWPGTTLLLSAVVALSYALQEGDTAFKWHSAPIIAAIVCQGVLWIAFFSWEYYLTNNTTQMLPIWPTRLFSSRVLGSVMIVAFLSGIPLYSTYIYVPQRLEIVGGLTALKAGVTFLLVPVVCFMASGWGSYLCLKLNIGNLVQLAAMSFQAVGLGLLAWLPTEGSFPARGYGYETLIGVGFGLALPSVSLIARVETNHLDHSVTMSAISSLRSLGGTVGVSIGHVLLTSKLLGTLPGLLTPQQLSDISTNPESLSSSTITQFYSPQQLSIIKNTYGNGFNLINRVNMGIALATVVFAILAWRRNPMTVAELDERESKEKRKLDQMAREAQGLSLPQRIYSRSKSELQRRMSSVKYGSRRVGSRHNPHKRLSTGEPQRRISVNEPGPRRRLPGDVSGSRRSFNYPYRKASDDSYELDLEANWPWGNGASWRFEVY